MDLKWITRLVCLVTLQAFWFHNSGIFTPVSTFILSFGIGYTTGILIFDVIIEPLLDRKLKRIREEMRS